MPILSFTKQFVPLIESGKKRQTIRVARKYPIKVGDKLYLYSGLRTKNCQKIITPYDIDADKKYVICKSVDSIDIVSHTLCDRYGGYFIVNKNMLSTEEALQLIRGDGFDSRHREEEISSDYYDKNSFFEYFYKNYGSVFEGELIKW